MAIIDVVKWEAQPNVLAWKFPSNELSTWTQLIVSESQEALLLKEGQFVGPFAAGRHILSTENYPILIDFLKIPFGKSPYTAEVWFLQRAITLDVKWGTPTPILLQDPKYQIMLPVQAFGQYGIRVGNSRAFMEKLVGTLPAFTVSTVQKYFKGIISTLVKDVIATYLVEKEVSILHISAHLIEISSLMEEMLQEKVREFGVEITHFNINSIDTNTNDPAVARLRRALAEKAEMDIMGTSYHQKRSFDVMETAAGNEGAGSATATVMGAGIGMGVGVGLAPGMASSVTQMGANMDVSSQVKCAKCGSGNKSSNRFCSSCGEALQGSKIAQSCVSCGNELPADAKYCSSCGVAQYAQCSQCNALLPGNAKFCSTCGASVK